jgi:hypothetical protein
MVSSRMMSAKHRTSSATRRSWRKLQHPADAQRSYRDRLPAPAEEQRVRQQTPFTHRRAQEHKSDTMKTYHEYQRLSSWGECTVNCQMRVNTQPNNA